MSEQDGIESITTQTTALEDRDLAQVVSDLTVQAVEPRVLEPGKHYALTTPAGGETVVVDMTDPRRTGRPRRKTGRALARDGDAFARYLHKHFVRGTTEVWSDASTQKLVGVLDAHGDADDAAGWGGHRVELGLVHTPAWEQWAAMSGRMIEQTAFAEFIEQRQVDFTTPTGAQMLELAQTLEATQSVDFKGAVSLQAGARTLQYAETVSAKAGQTGSITIPNKVTLSLKPYYGSGRYAVGAFFRYKISPQGLRLGVVLDNPDLILQDAYAGVVDTVVETLKELGHDDVDVLSGVAPAALA